MDDSEAMINQLRSTSNVTSAQVAAATKNAINNPRLGKAVLESIREMGAGGAQLRRSFERAHELLRTLSEEHPTLRSLVDQWGVLHRRFCKHLDRSMVSTTKMQGFLTGYIEVLLPALKRDDLMLDEAGNIAEKKALCNEFLEKITQHQNMAKCDQDNFASLVSDVKDLGQETSKKLQHIDGRSADPKKMQGLKAQLAQLQNELSRVQTPDPDKAWLYAAAGSGLAGAGLLVLKALLGPHTLAAFVVAELVATGCLVTYLIKHQHHTPAIGDATSKLLTEIAATKKEIDAIHGHLAVEAQIESVQAQLLFFAKTWNLIYHDLELLRGYFDSAATTTTQNRKVFEDMISLTESVYPLLTRALDDYATCNSPLDT